MDSKSNKPQNMGNLEKVLGHEFADPGILARALTHTSHAREQCATNPGSEPCADYEQLEFLGDAVLGFVATGEIFQRYPQLREGSLSKLRAHLISEKYLIRVARTLDLGSYLRLGKGEEKSGGRAKTALLVDALEAVIGAMYLDGGLGAARDFVLRQVIRPELESIHLSGSQMPLTDYKSALQERLQAGGRAQPTYALVDESGPEHHKTFVVEARVYPLGRAQTPELVGRAQGPRKKTAEQEAARQLLQQLAMHPLAAEEEGAKGSSKSHSR